MSVVFHDLQDHSNPFNGTRMESKDTVNELFRSFEHRAPFFFELRQDCGVKLTVGFATDCAVLQHAAIDGSAPYLMAVADGRINDDEFVSFLAGNTPTPVSRRFCLSTEQAINVIAQFIADGAMSHAIAWEEI